MNYLGDPIKDKQLLIDLFAPSEGSINLYYGRIGSGKTYAGTADILDIVKNGEVVYCNWHIVFEGFDERQSWAHSVFKFIFFRPLYFKFPKGNLHFFNVEGKDVCPACGKIHEVNIEFLASLNDCHIFIDEGQWVFDSRSRLNQDWRKLVLHTRHMNRTLSIVSQRTQAIEVSARGQVNRFYKCEKIWSWPWLRFRRSEYQDMKENDVDESVEPISIKQYWGKKKVMEAYDTKYLRAGVARSQEIFFEAYRLNFFERLILLFRNTLRLKSKEVNNKVDNKVDNEIDKNLARSGIMKLKVKHYEKAIHYQIADRPNGDKTLRREKTSKTQRGAGKKSRQKLVVKL